MTCDILLISANHQTPFICSRKSTNHSRESSLVVPVSVLSSDMISQTKNPRKFPGFKRFRKKKKIQIIKNFLCISEIPKKF